MCVRWLDDIADFNFDVTHVPGTKNPSDPLSPRAFTDGDGPATSTGDPDQESQQELFSLLGRDAPEPSLLNAIRDSWTATRNEAATIFTMGTPRSNLPPHQSFHGQDRCSWQWPGRNLN